MTNTITPSIAGVSIKNLKRISDHEGMVIYQGNVYIDGKKVGFWSQDFWGGPDLFQFDITELLKRAEEYFTKNPMVDFITLYGKSIDEVDFNNLPIRNAKDIEHIEKYLIYELVQLTNLYKRYKACVKDGFTVLGKLDCIRGSWKIPKNIDTIGCGIDKDVVVSMFKPDMEKYPYLKLKIYEKPEDFIK